MDNELRGHVKDNLGHGNLSDSNQLCLRDAGEGLGVFQTGGERSCWRESLRDMGWGERLRRSPQLKMGEEHPKTNPGCWMLL